MMKDRNFGLGRRLLGGGLVAGAIGLGLLATASGAQVTPPTRPVPPAPPEAPAAPLPPTPPVAPTPPVPPMHERVVVIHRDARHAHAIAGNVDAEVQSALADAHREIAGARREMADANRDAEREIANARCAHGAMVDKVVAETRHNMAEKCRAKGTPVSESADWTTLALCGEDIGAMVHKAMAEARAGVVAAHDISEEDRARALRAIDRAEARSDRRSATPN